MIFQKGHPTGAKSVTGNQDLNLFSYQCEEWSMSEEQAEALYCEDEDEEVYERINHF